MSDLVYASINIAPGSLQDVMREQRLSVIAPTTAGGADQNR